jgi:hypothetical protein
MFLSFDFSLSATLPCTLPVEQLAPCTCSKESHNCTPVVSRQVIVEYVAPSLTLCEPGLLTNCVKTGPLQLCWKMTECSQSV